MSLFLLTVKQRIAANGTVLEKGMTVEVSANTTSDLFANGSIRVVNAFMNKYSLDLKKISSSGVIQHYFEVVKLS